MRAHKLFPHQEQALERIRGQARVALFMEMRLGKTPVIIRWAQHLLSLEPNSGRVLVVGPMSVLDDWEDELRREGIRRRDITRLDGMTQTVREETAYGGPGWYLINYEGVRINDAMAEMDWEVVILDESTAIRNPQAAITKRLTKDYVHVPYRAILTGDPVPEGITDYFSQFQFLYGSFMSYGNFWAFRNAKFKQNPRVTWDWQPKPGLRDEVKQWVHEHAVVMTKEQHGIGGKKFYSRRIIDMNAAQKKAHKEIMRDFSYEYIETNFATVRDVWLARIAGGFSPDRENPEMLSDAKIKEIIALKKGELKKQAVVVWFRFNEELWATTAALQKAGIRAVGVAGDTPKADRIKIRKRFMRGEFDVICVQVRLGRFGWNLSRATTAIYYSNALDRESRAQSEDRIVHPTKKKPLLYIDLETKGSIDTEVIRLQREKRISSRAFARRLNAAVWAEYWRQHPGENQKAKGGKSTAKKAETEVTSSRLPVRRHFPGQRYQGD